MRRLKKQAQERFSIFRETFYHSYTGSGFLPHQSAIHSTSGVDFGSFGYESINCSMGGETPVSVSNSAAVPYHAGSFCSYSSS
jgi:hypothetical protein